MNLYSYKAVFEWFGYVSPRPIQLQDTLVALNVRLPERISKSEEVFVCLPTDALSSSRTDGTSLVFYKTKREAMKNLPEGHIVFKIDVMR